MPVARTALRSGFSVPQLLVVIALIATLAALLFPVLNSQTTQAKNVRCIQNLKSIGVAIAAYAADRDGMMPPRYLGNFREKNTVPSNLRQWGSRLVNLGYVENPDILYCPAFAPFNEATYFQTFNKRIQDGGNRTRRQTPSSQTAM